MELSLSPPVALKSGKEWEESYLKYVSTYAR